MPSNSVGFPRAMRTWVSPAYVQGSLTRGAGDAPAYEGFDSVADGFRHDWLNSMGRETWKAERAGEDVVMLAGNGSAVAVRPEWRLFCGKTDRPHQANATVWEGKRRLPKIAPRLSWPKAEPGCLGVCRQPAAAFAMRGQGVRPPCRRTKEGLPMVCPPPRASEYHAADDAAVPPPSGRRVSCYGG